MTITSHPKLILCCLIHSSDLTDLCCPRFTLLTSLMFQLPEGNLDFAPRRLSSEGEFLASLKSTVSRLLPSARKDVSLGFQLAQTMSRDCLKGVKQVVAQHTVLVKGDSNNEWNWAWQFSYSDIQETLQRAGNIMMIRSILLVSRRICRNTGIPKDLKLASECHILLHPVGFNYFGSKSWKPQNKLMLEALRHNSGEDWINSSKNL